MQEGNVRIAMVILGAIALLCLAGIIACDHTGCVAPEILKTTLTTCVGVMAGILIPSPRIPAA